MSTESLAAVKLRIAEYQRKFRHATQLWRLSYRVLLVTSAMFSGSAAIVGQLEYYKFAGADDAASILAGLAAAVTTLIAALNFEANWRINQESRRNVDVIALEADKSTAEPDGLLSALQDVIRNHDAAKTEWKSSSPLETSART